jgi:26 proteasome complex subunit DSS1
MASAQNQEKQKGMAEEKNLAALGVLEEDDEFEEFAAEGLSE